ncbi:hypothetical protein Dda_1981 [Drechslerella dactyloides]|uniref:UBX domain-containing protein n=1 Tax=Drechslerella dactyloides TaxID=74499 RepID=A0AAD6J2V9_DREDA|nr:hypothetical protein Dda_1981 [Drechslerella dactyloides]
MTIIRCCQCIIAFDDAYTPEESNLCTPRSEAAQEWSCGLSYRRRKSAASPKPNIPISQPRDKQDFDHVPCGSFQKRNAGGGGILTPCRGVLHGRRVLRLTACRRHAASDKSHRYLASCPSTRSSQLPSPSSRPPVASFCPVVLSERLIMATVVVNGPNQRRLNVKVTPGTILNDVLGQACDRFGLSVDSFTLRHGKTNVDLTLPFRLSRLGPGAKLDLVKREGGKSGTAIITVALQFIDNSVPRMIEKFPSSTTLWEILRKFEENSGGKLLLTERAVPDNTKQGAGRLYYEMPTIQIISRELASLEDLKKTLSALGFTSGTALLKIKFTPTTIPLEDAVLAFADLSSSSKPDSTAEASTSSSAAAPTDEASTSEPISETLTPETAPTPIDTETYPVPTFPDQISPPPESAHQTVEPVHRENTDVGPNNRAISVFNPGTSATPSAASVAIDEEVYEVSINQARQYQAQLKAATINKRLLTEAQKQKLADEEKARRLAVDKVDVRIRFPEGSVVQSVFTQGDTAEDLYAFVKGVMRHPDKEFHLALPGPKQEAIPSDTKTIIVDLGITHATLLNFYWKETVGTGIKKQDPLNAEYREKARQMEVPKEPDAMLVDEEVPANQAKKAGSSSGGGGGSSGGSKVPKWLKFGKK